MEYKYGKNDNYEDFSSGHVLYNAKTATNFPVRLAQELYGRCLEHSNSKKDICLYDCCCGGGYLLTVLGFLNQDTIGEIIGSDIDDNCLSVAKANLSLLTEYGIEKRISEIRNMIGQYNKQSHNDAEKSALKLQSLLKHDMKTHVFTADVLSNINLDKTPDIILTDIPYGNLVSWNNSATNHESKDPQVPEANIVDLLLDSLYKISGEKTIIGICMNKNQKVTSTKFARVEKQMIGKRKFEILRKKVIT